MANQATDQIHSIAALLAASLPAAAVASILGEHTADATGHCSGCRYPTTAAPVWPCRLWEIGNEAKRIRSAAGRR